VCFIPDTYMGIYTMKFNKEGENISVTQVTELVMPIMYINGKYTLLNILLPNYIIYSLFKKINLLDYVIQNW